MLEPAEKRLLSCPSEWAIWEGEHMTAPVIVQVMALSASVSAFVTLTLLAAFR
jgi:hypothetical protein